MKYWVQFPVLYSRSLMVIMHFRQWEGREHVWRCQLACTPVGRPLCFREWDHLLEVREEVLRLEERRSEMAFKNRDSVCLQNTEWSGHRMEGSRYCLTAILECWSLLGLPISKDLSSFLLSLSASTNWLWSPLSSSLHYFFKLFIHLSHYKV